MSSRVPEPAVWITSDVALPQALLDAHTNRSLVLFVGAGASVDAPSDLPLFDKLARELAHLARVPFEPGVAIDRFLGSMPANFDVHAQTRRLIARSDSHFNTTHSALVRLSDSGTMRIVTTKFDNHLMDAAADHGIRAGDCWIGPALPLGDKFTGIIHLHGSVVREDPKELVLTDGDFGRAYLTHSWATRFLLPMFREFTVLFVGYSHDDPIMRYLALGVLTTDVRHGVSVW